MEGQGSVAPIARVLPVAGWSAPGRDGSAGSESTPADGRFAGARERESAVGEAAPGNPTPTAPGSHRGDDNLITSRERRSNVPGGPTVVPLSPFLAHQIAGALRPERQPQAPEAHAALAYQIATARRTTFLGPGLPLDLVA